MASREEINLKEERCLGRYDPRNDPIEFANLIALILLLMGIAFVAIGYLIPRDYKFDPNMDARKMEAIGIYYAKRVQALDACVITGMTLCGTGGLILASLLMFILCSGDLTDNPYYEQNLSDRPLRSQKDASCYGSSDSSKTPILREDSVAEGPAGKGQTKEPESLKKNP